jgi:CRISPR/Cas system CSM-associated protein Csm3 (group 7 of RAMP superfamily)
MFRTRYEIAGELTALSPLHIGTGTERTVTGVIGKPGDDPPGVAAIVRDCRGRPFPPGTTLKGLLRRTGEVHLANAARVEALFGAIRDEEGGGTMGALLVRGAAEIAPGNADGMPYAESASQAGAGDLGPGVFVAARTRVDRHAGTAADNTLHFAEMAAPGARFALRLLLDPGSADRNEAEALLQDLVRALSLLCLPEGAAIGRGQADGQGRVQLIPNTVTVTRLFVTRGGTLGRENATRIWQNRGRVTTPTAPSRVNLTLTCAGPFGVIDSSYRPQRDQDGDPVGPQLKSQTGVGRPLLLGSSLTGALRTRAAWLEARRLHRAGRSISSGRDCDNWRTVDQLSSVERLFGVTGLRGLVQVKKLEVVRGERASFTSVKLDRFSGAPIDNALFQTELFIGTTIQVTVALAERPRVMMAETDRQLFDRLIEDVIANGIVLGHGGSKGFGWFAARRA